MENSDQGFMYADRETPIVIGLDVGSTTVKAAVIDPHTKAVLWHDYQRHHTAQPECVMGFMSRIGQAFPKLRQEDIRIFVTGSGSGPLAEPLGARFVQEVNAVTMTVESLHPGVLSVVELGGQDAKIIMLRENVETQAKIGKNWFRRRTLRKPVHIAGCTAADAVAEAVQQQSARSWRPWRSATPAP